MTFSRVEEVDDEQPAAAEISHRPLERDIGTDPTPYRPCPYYAQQPEEKENRRRLPGGSSISKSAHLHLVIDRTYMANQEEDNRTYIADQE